MRLTDAAIARLRPGAREFSVWDSRIPSLGVRVRPSGGKTYILLRQADGASKRISLGPVLLKGVAEVRRECLEHQASAEPDRASGPAHAVPLFRDFVEGPWKEAHFDRYKPSTRRSASWLLNGRLLPAFGTKPLDRITPAQVERWFDAFSRTAPGNANHALPLLRKDHDVRGRERPHRRQPCEEREKEPAASFHALPVPGGDRPPPSGPGRPDRKELTPAGRHHPSPAAHRMRQERDRAAAPVGGP